MNAVHLDWRDGPPVPVSAPASPMMRVVSVALHAAVVLGLSQVHGVKETIIDTFEEPRLVFVAATQPMTPPLTVAAPKTQVEPPAAVPAAVRPPALSQDRNAVPDPPVAAPAPALPSLATADFGGVGSALALESPGTAAPVSGVVRAGQSDAGNARGAGVGHADDAGEGQAVSPPVFDAAYLNNPRPVYPEVAARRGVTGVVLLRVLVSVDGRADKVEVERSSGSRLLDESAIATVQSSWRFTPARRGGLAVAAPVIVPIRFELSGH
ncbi:MAG: TonB family protein [Vicinamibacterales bacterium]